MFVDKFSVSYYETILWWQVPTNKILALSKLIFEDIIQCSLQVIYLFLASKDQKSIVVIAVSLCFAVPSIAFSTWSLFSNSTSNLTKEDYTGIFRNIGELTEDEGEQDLMATVIERPGRAEDDVSAIPPSKRRFDISESKFSDDRLRRYSEDEEEEKELPKVRNFGRGKD